MNKSLNFNLVKRLAYLIVLLSFIANGFATNRKTENLILITLDGLRYQELFNGLDLGVLKATTKSKKVDESKSYKKLI